MYLQNIGLFSLQENRTYHFTVEALYPYDAFRSISASPEGLLLLFGAFRKRF